MGPLRPNERTSEPSAPSTSSTSSRVLAKSLVVVASLALVLAACSSTGVKSRAGRSSRPTTPSSAPASAPSTAPKASPTTLGSLHDITFVNPDSGWALGELPAGTVVARSTDGGRSWSAWGAPLPGAALAAEQAGFGASLTVMLAGNGVGSNVADGVVSVQGSPTLLVSTDRLMSWHAVGFPAPVLAVAAAPGPVWPGGTPATAPGVDEEPLWVLVGPLPAKEAPAQAKDFGPPGSLLVALLYPATASWKPYGRLAGPSWTGRSAVSSARFVRLGAGSGYAVVTGFATDPSVPAGYQPVALVEETTNYGFTWRLLTTPCGTLGNAALLSAVSLDVLWLGCAGEPSAGIQMKAVYRSLDAGRSWEEVWDGGSHGTLPGAVPGAVPISSGYLEDVVGLSPADAFVGLGRGGLLHTSDGGRTWQSVVPHIGGSGGIEQLDVLDAADAWAHVGDGRLWATTNGRQWSQIAKAR